MAKRPGSPLSAAARKPAPLSSNTISDDEFGLPGPRKQDLSQNGTVILSSPLSESALTRYQPPDAFPTFKNGDVIITTDLDSCPRTFQLHSSVLCRHSPFIAMELQPDATWYHFTVEEVDGKVGLIRKPANGERPAVSQDNSYIINRTYIKVEDPSDTRASLLPAPLSTDLVTTTQPNHYSKTIACYTQIFAAFYNIPPNISTTSISAALSQSESLVNLAAELGCVHLLQSHLASVYVSYRQDLYIAIAQDPPRWLHLSLSLENRSIYTECLIHLVGAHPKMPWPTRRTAIPDALQHLIQQKAEKLATRRGEVERELLLLTLHIIDPLTRRKRPLDPREKAEFESWLAVQVFRDELAQHISAVSDHSTPSLHLGRLYRGIYRGDWRWMSTEYVGEMLEPTMRLKWKDLGEDMRGLRAQAGKVVERLAQNRLMVEPDGRGLGYLTCVGVGDGDVPWLAGEAEGAVE